MSTNAYHEWFFLVTTIIFVDALTNPFFRRGSLQKYLRSKHCKQNVKLYLMSQALSDIKSFILRFINDNFLKITTLVNETANS